jgi:hypothetical protein
MPAEQWMICGIIRVRTLTEISRLANTRHWLPNRPRPGGTGIDTPQSPAGGRIVRQNGHQAVNAIAVLQNPDAIRHFQSLCDACQELAHRHHGPSELRLYADGYLHALRRTGVLDHSSERKLEDLIDRWIRDPSSFIGPDGDPRTLYESRPY